MILAAFLLPILACSTTAAFSFSNPGISVTAGPGLGCGPTVFNTYSHDLTTFDAGANAVAIANALGCPAIPGYGGYGPCGFGPAGADEAVNEAYGRQALEDNTFATSFYTAGTSPFGGLCNACISGNAPQQFTLQFF